MSAPREPTPPAALSDAQRLLADAFRQFVPLTERADLAIDLERIVAGNERLSPLQQADIYREQFWLRHRDALAEDFPALVAVLGWEAFEDFARCYFTRHPPSSFTLRDLGNDLPGFAAGYQGFDASVAELARDLAVFELAFVRIFDGPDVEPLTLERALSMAPDGWMSSQIVLHPLHRLFELGYPVHDVRKAVKRGECPAPSELPTPRRTLLSMWRHPDLCVRFRENEELEHRMLLFLKAGATLLEACERIAAAATEEQRASLPADLQRWFERWASRGWIVDVVGRRDV